MANKFFTVLEHIGVDVEKFFKSPVAAEIETEGLDIATMAFPALTPLFKGLGAAIATSQAFAQKINPTGNTDSQVVAMSLTAGQQAFNAYQQATGSVIETPTQAAIIKQLIQLVGLIPAPTIGSPVAVAPATPAPTPAL
jgi:hypothetical protein